VERRAAITEVFLAHVRHSAVDIRVVYVKITELSDQSS
jgi:hypothetical protein